MKLEQKIFKTNFLLENILKKYDIQVLSHTSITKFKNIKTINWIPDFQAYSSTSNVFKKRNRK